LIAWLPGSVRPAIAQEQAQIALVDEHWHPRTSKVRPRPPLTSRVLVWPYAVDSRDQSLSVEELSSIGRRAQPGSSRDTLTNGALIGALIGAVGFGAFGAFICHLHQEEGGASCLRDTMRVGAIGAAIGMGAGVAVDAALTSNAGVTVRIRVDF
jgi:hypothetical protein